MNLRSSPSDDSALMRFQIQKLYIKKLPENRDPELLEQELREYFCTFGSVIDLKALKNRALIREEWALRIRDF